jgi:thioredoxin reductase (NADPH)
MNREDRVEQDLQDVVIVGAGPAGTAAAIYTARADLTTLALDKGLRTGALGMAGRIANYPGVSGVIEGAALLERMREQAEGFGARFVTDRAIHAKLGPDVKEVWGNQGVYRARAVIVATGSMGRSRTVPGEERLVGRGVSYCAICDGAFFRDEEVAVAGNNDEAFDEALFVSRFASRVHMLAPGTEPRASSELVQEARADPRVTIHQGARLREVIGQERVEAVRIATGAGQEQTLPVSGVFVFLQGARPIVDFLGDQLPVTESGCLTVDRAMQTSILGVFAVGDVLCNHLKQAVVAAGEGAIAAMSARRYLQGLERLRPDWA